MNKKKKLYQKWWFWICIVVAILIIASIIIYYRNKNINDLKFNLNKEVTTGKLTYYVQEDWKTKENIDGDDTFAYYYPAKNVTLMIGNIKGDDYGYDAANNDFLNGFVEGLEIDDNDFTYIVASPLGFCQEHSLHPTKGGTSTTPLPGRG